MFDKYIPLAVKFDATTLVDMEPDSCSISPNLKSELENLGHISPMIGFTYSAAPKISFKTSQVQLIIKAATIGAAITVYFQKQNEDGTMAATYKSFTFADGFIVPTTLSASPGEKASLEVEIYPLLVDGSAFLQVGTAAPAALASTGKRWILGPVTCDTAKSHVSDFSLTFGYEVKTNEGEDGEIYPTIAWAEAFAPKMSLTASTSAATEELLVQGKNIADLSIGFKGLDETGLSAEDDFTITAGKAIVKADELSGRPAVTKLSVDILAPDHTSTDWLQIGAAA